MDRHEFTGEVGKRYKVTQVGCQRAKRIEISAIDWPVIWYWPMADSGGTHGQHERLLNGYSVKSLEELS